VGSGYVLPMRHDKRRLTISNLNLSQVSAEWIFAYTTSLALNRCQGFQEMTKKLVMGRTVFVNLKSLTIENAIISLSSEVKKTTTKTPKRSSPTLDLLPNLEELHLRRVNLVSLSELQVHLGLTLASLKLLEFSMCGYLRTLIEGHFLSIPKLEEIEISYCNSLKNLHKTVDLPPKPPKPFLPNLRIIKLRNLPHLESVCYGMEAWECLEQVEITNCVHLRNLPISSKTCARIKEIKGDRSWWNNLIWDTQSTPRTLEPCFKQLKNVNDESPHASLFANQ